MYSLALSCWKALRFSDSCCLPATFYFWRRPFLSLRNFPTFFLCRKKSIKKRLLLYDLLEQTFSTYWIYAIASSNRNLHRERHRRSICMILVAGAYLLTSSWRLATSSPEWISIFSFEILKKGVNFWRAWKLRREWGLLNRLKDVFSLLRKWASQSTALFYCLVSFCRSTSVNVCIHPKQRHSFLLLTISIWTKSSVVWFSFERKHSSWLHRRKIRHHR